MVRRRTPTAAVGADQTWNVHYSRFMESALDFHHVPFVHGAYAPGIGQVLTDVELIDDGTRLSMTARLNDPESGRSLAVGGEVTMPYQRHAHSWRPRKHRPISRRESDRYCSTAPAECRWGRGTRVGEGHPSRSMAWRSGRSNGHRDEQARRRRRGSIARTIGPQVEDASQPR